MEASSAMGSRGQPWSRRQFVAASACAATAWAAGKESAVATLRAGACAVDISPRTLPVIVSGSFLTKSASRVRDPLHARALVLDDGATRVAIVVVDTLMMPREMLDAVKADAAKRTGIAADRILIAATHSHSCPSVMGALGTGVDAAYAAWLPGKLVEAVGGALASLAPARVGWATAEAPDHTHCRRWIFRPDRMRSDPFGQRNVRAHMHPGYQNPDCIGPSGPPDPQLSLLAVQRPDGRPVAALANYSMHYYGAGPVSADYYGEFCRRLTALLGADRQFVAIMSHGTSGDLHWMDYGQPKNPPGLGRYADALARKAHAAWQAVEFRDAAPLRMAQTTLKLGRRVPDAERLAWAKAMVAKMGDRPPKSLPEVYAREALYLREEPERELVLQALRIGDLGITAIPCEVYGITGLKLKARSPLTPTMNVELANGAEGYIPPPALHPLGGYNTWPARTAGLVPEAEPRIADAVLALLEKVSGKPRRKPEPTRGPYAQAILAARPLVYWPMGELEGPRALDASGHGHDATYEDFIVFYLAGPTGRAAQFAGGRMKASLDGLGAAYSVELWLWNGLPADARPVAGYVFSRGPDGDEACPGDHLGIGGTHLGQGKLLFFNGNGPKEALTGATTLGLRTWHHVAMVRAGKRVTVYLDGSAAPEIASEAAVSLPRGARELFVGGRCDGFASFEGRLCGVALYPRALTADEVARHYKAAQRKGKAS